MLPAPEPRHYLVLHLERLMNDSVPGLRLDTQIAQAVSAAVVHYLEEQGLQLPLPDEYLHLMIYRALRSLRQNDAAAAWAAAQLDENRTDSTATAEAATVAESPVPYVSPPTPQRLPIFDPEIWPGPVPYIVWQLFASRLVRPLRSMTREGRILWTLDFRRIKCDQAGWMELVLFPGLHVLLEQLADAWDASNGEGTLGLRGLYAAGFAPTPPSHRQRNAKHSAFAPLDAPAVRAFILRVLQNLRRARHWTHTPEVIYLDLPPARHRRRNAPPPAP